MASPTSYVPGLLNVPALLSAAKQTVYTSPNGDAGTRIAFVSLYAIESASPAPPGAITFFLVPEGGTAGNANRVTSTQLANNTNANIMHGTYLSEGDFIAVDPVNANEYHLHIYGIEMS